MRSTAAPNRLWTLTARLAVALLVVGCVGAQGGSVEAAEVVAAAGPSAHACRCGDACRGDSCCCSHGTTRTKAKGAGTAPTAPPGARPQPTPGHRPSNPCVQAAPCGDAGTPINPSAEPIGRAALSLGAAIVAPTPGRWVGVETRAEAPAGRAGRLDEPPEAGDVA